MNNCADSTEREAVLRSLKHDELVFTLNDWETWAHEQQIAPDRLNADFDWSTWLIMGGRGSGKTRAGAEWVRHVVRSVEAGAEASETRMALVAVSYAEAREVMVDGVSGLKALNWLGEEPVFKSSRRMLKWPNGVVAQLFSAADPEQLRGPQFSHAWLDEFAKWPNAALTYDMLQFGLRLGSRPRQVITTTPRATPMMKKLLADKAVVTTKMTTGDNAANLPAAFLNAVNRAYGATRLGRQELDGELIEDLEDGLFRWGFIDGARVNAPPPLKRIVVAVDPPVSHVSKTSVCGIVVAGVCVDGEAYVLEDASIARATPTQWADKTCQIFEHWQADRVVAELNQGGDMVETVLRSAYPALPFSGVRATRGKRLRAEPVAALYERGLVHHAGVFKQLEDQMCRFDHDGLSAGESPDRLDALVWALTELMMNNSDASPRIRKL